ncbi:MAG TPA: MFS transporter [Candidatus Limnocylindrales bacterium]
MNGRIVNGRPSTPEGASSALAVFRNRPFLIIWLSQVATQVGGNMVLYGLTVLIFTASGSNSAVSVLLISFLAPAVIFGALAGVYVDRFDRRLVLVATSLVRAGLFFLLAFAGPNVGAILLLTLLVSVATTFFAPAELSVIPLVVPRGQLTAANGIFTLTLNAAFAVGYTLLGPLVVTIAGPTLLIGVVAVLYLVSAALCWTLAPAPPLPLPAGRDTLHDAEAAVGSVVGQLREGVAYIRANPAVAWALTYLGVAASIVGVLGALGPGFAVHVLNLASKDFVVVVLPLGLGVVAGVLLVNVIRAMVPRRQTIETGLVTLGVCLVLITIANPISQLLQRVNAAQPMVDASALVSVLSVVVAIAFVAGVAYASVAIPAQTELQEVIPEEVRGRVFGILNTLVSIASFLPIIVAGVVSEAVGTAPVLLAAAGLVGLSGVGSILLRGRRPATPLPGGRGEPPAPGATPEAP